MNLYLSLIGLEITSGNKRNNYHYLRTPTMQLPNIQQIKY